jgi:membrane-bound lytic murein transglycosylase D
MHRIIVFFFLILSFSGFSQISVPDEMQFADITLRIDHDAKKRIAESLNILTRNQRFFLAKSAKSGIYFPIIEKIFEEEGIPEDFKYLIIQESAFVADAVSTSNAVGFWQFKRESAMEVGVRVDNLIDERMNITVATRGAARYFRRNYGMLQNWLHTLLSYNLGAGGTRAIADPDEIKSKKIKITGDTHIYIIKFLAHKLAYQKQTAINMDEQIILLEYPQRGKTLDEIANFLQVDPIELKSYNLWVRSKSIPDDRDYIVHVPVHRNQAEILAQKMGVAQLDQLISLKQNTGKQKEKIREQEFAVNKPFKAEKVNGLSAYIAQSGDDASHVAVKADISRKKFLKYNDIRIFEPLVPGQVYYLESKNSAGEKDYYTVQEDETLWQISQKLGIKMQSLLKFNRLDEYEKLQEGRVLWIAETRPKNIAVEIKQVKKADKNELVKANQQEKKNSVVSSITNSDKPDVLKADVSENKENKTEEKGSVEERDNTVIEKDISKNQKQEIAVKKDTVTVIPVNSKKELTIASETKTPEKKHIVKTGETLYGIARSYGVTITDLQSWNKMDSMKVNIGQELLIYEAIKNKSSVEKKDEVILHTVESGDSLYKIAKQYNVEIQSIQEWNDKKELSVSVGEILKIYKSAK